MEKSVYTVSQGMAWDQVARKRLASEKNMGLLLPGNADEMDTLLFSGEVQLDIPEIEVPAARSLPPWERM